MNKLVQITTIVFGLTASSFAQRPVMITEDALTLGKGKIGAGVGFEYLSKHASPFPNAPQSVFRLFVLALHQGVAENVNFDLDWRGGLLAELDNGKKKFDWGDLVVSTKINFFRERDPLPAVGIRTAIKLPNTTYNAAKLGSNQMDYHSQLLLTKHFGEVETRMNFGFSIIGDPTTVGMQDDVYSISAGVITALSEQSRFFFEIHGFTGYQDHDDKLITRFGMIFDANGWGYGVYSTLRALGNNQDFGTAFESSENWSIGFRILKTFDLHLFD